MILITGASGTVGGEVVKALGGGATVRAGYRTRPQNIPKGVESVALDFDRPETIRPALAGVDTVFLLSTMVDPERKVVDEAKRAGVQRIVKLSVYGAAQEGFTFARWHRAVEKHIEASGVPWTFLRPAGFMQNFFNYMGETIRKQSAFYTATGNKGAGAHIDARDIGAAAARVLTGKGHEGKAYELTGPRSITYDEAAQILSNAVGREIKHVPITPEQFKQGALAMGMPEVYVDALVDLDRAYVTGTLTAVTPTVKELTGRDPVRFEQFAKDYADKFRPELKQP
jgi:uncharacterized protein YbjT (DUF2867 family)